MTDPSSQPTPDPRCAFHQPALALADAALASLTGSDAAAFSAFAPGRVNLIGEHTDYNGGFVLPMAIQLGIYVSARPRTDGIVRVHSAQLNETAEFSVRGAIQSGLPTWSNYIRGVLAGMQKAGISLGGFDAAIHATLPAGGGLSSSAAVEVAFAMLVEAMTGTTLDPVEKALLCQKAEHHFAGTPCGIMDQFAVIFGRKGHLLLLDCRTQERTLVRMEGGDVGFLVINTMVKHDLSNGGYRDRRDDCFAAAGQLWSEDLRGVTLEQLHEARLRLTDTHYRRVRHVLTENDRTLAAVAALRNGNWLELGALMQASHDSLRDDFEVSCSELDLVVATARALGEAAGVYGCRMTGGGFGGCCVALVKSSAAPSLAAAIREKYLATRGLDPAIFSVVPSDGATVLARPAGGFATT